MSQKTYKFHIHNMHCNACVFLTESELGEHPKVSSVKSNLANHSVEIIGDFGDISREEIAVELTKLLSEHKLSTEKQNKRINWKEFKVAVPVAFGFAVLFIFLQKIGIVNLVNVGNITLGTAFVVGIIASLSSCMAVVGGLLLSMSATFAREGDRFRLQILFHGGRLVSFFILGGIIGALGSVFQLGAIGIFVLGIIIGLVMLLLGINLLDIFHFTKRFQISMPSFLSKRVLNITKINHTFVPLFVGIATFFLPCGFTQSMQIFTLSTGNFMTGGLMMLSFALGTLPVLLIISFSSFSFKDSPKAGIFFKSAGLIVIMFAIFNIINSLVAIGWINPIFNF